MIKFLVVCVLFHTGICCASKKHNVTSQHTTVTPAVDDTSESGTDANVTTSSESPDKIWTKERLERLQRIMKIDVKAPPTDPPKENITLAELDKRIVDAIQHPKHEREVGLQLLQDTFTYFSEVDDIADAFVVDYHDGMIAINESGVTIKPKFIELTYDKKKLREIYGWDGKQAEEFKTNIIGSKYVWERVQRLLKEAHDPTTTTTTTTTMATTTSVTTIPSHTTTCAVNLTEISAETIEFEEVPVSGEKR